MMANTENKVNASGIIINPTGVRNFNMDCGAEGANALLEASSEVKN